MTINLELTSEEFAILNSRAETQGVDIETVLHDLIAPLVALTKPVARLGSWQSEVGTVDAEEQAEREREWAEMQNNINRWRTEQRRS